MLNFSKDFRLQKPEGAAVLIEITQENLYLLNRIVNLRSRQDTYTNSASYFAMTGRKGLWLYGDEKTAMVIARHPNDPEQLLFFPPIGLDPVGLIQAARFDPEIPAGKIRLARVAPEDSQLSSRLQVNHIGTEKDEDVLDWRYPVHILGTEDVSEHKGSKFRDFRKNINKALARGLRSEHISMKHHVLKAIGICKQWSERRVSQSFFLEDLLEPTKKALELLEQKAMAMDGLVIYEGSAPISYIIWEETNPVLGMANSISGMSIKQKGTDEFAMLEMCKELSKKGYKRVCIGGSESEGLDAFKRKMCPVQSIPLYSLRIISP